ncbi:uncharacterized protein PHACADRAFT_179870 [Phanerochaete carnosa HHB-10118-sp]|uniref:Uncharacterized protein n=1 Tax=Phanerochaete carnosa (strain HHB-10118-sp) TaxID=650164 RepID=K5WN76_PHACS|nr:uncharacterized protein PHACADRAFT_179870 [Phanerochaete carnosa HHB-10118-sp]EKM60669.1 hypothetical protein PHACADRAFT_179870 [Phanerochaete carnosa HHB-10118-sp]
MPRTNSTKLRERKRMACDELSPQKLKVLCLDGHKGAKKTRTISFDELAAWRQENPAVLTGYRISVDSWAECLATVWWWHNETVNIWTHLLGALASISLAGYLTYWTMMDSAGLETEPFYHLAPLNNEIKSLEWRDTAVFAVFFLGSAVCFTCSTAFHTSLCHREEIVRYTNKLDYLGILTLGTLNFFPTFYYGFYCDMYPGYLYMALMAVSGCVGIFLVCAPAYDRPEYRRTRAVTFVTLGLVAVLPFVHVVARYGLAKASRSMSLGWIALEIVAYLCGVVLYLLVKSACSAGRFPESVFPGRFDLVGSSHQLFHICSVLAVSFHYIATVEAFHYRHVALVGACPN